MHAINRPIIPLILCAAMFVTASLHGTQLTWDADPTTASPQDGAGVWDTTTNTWWDGAANVVWNNATPDSAVFGAGSGPAGVVSNSLPVTVGNNHLQRHGQRHLHPEQCSGKHRHALR